MQHFLALGESNQGADVSSCLVNIFCPIFDMLTTINSSQLPAHCCKGTNIPILRVEVCQHRSISHHAAILVQCHRFTSSSTLLSGPINGDLTIGGQRNQSGK